ncbi:MAG: pyridoxal phosphate-dependent aminotransferase [Melioribacteraceae bacterium]|nr:pyridoxal phosphate-dependent aminotransferase [Melioribacteraceae bacterium]
MIMSDRIEKVEMSKTMIVATRAMDLIKQGVELIDLTVGEPDFPTPDNVKAAAIKAINNNKTKYTFNEGYYELREAIIAKLKRDNNLEYTVKEILVSGGAKNSIHNALQALVSVGDEVIIPSPYWVSYPQMVKLADGIPVIVETKQEDNFKITPEILRNSITGKTKVLIICNPSNPTGSAYTKEELEALSKVIIEKDIYVISDEIYEKLIYDNFDFVSLASLNNEIKKRTVTINGVSKAFAMTGWRIGYAVGEESIIQNMKKVQSHGTSCACTISQMASVEALNGPQDTVEKMKVEYERRRNYLQKEIDAIEGINCNKPEGAFYLLPNISSYFGKSFNGKTVNNSDDFALYLLEEARVSTVPGTAFGAEGFIRLSYSNSMENLEKAVAAIKEALSKLK